MKRDTLLIVTTSYPQRGDGSEAAGAFVADFAQAMAEHVPVRVVAPGGVSSADVERGDISVHRYSSPGRPLSLLSPLRPTDWPAIMGTLRSLRAQTLAAADDGRVAHTLALWALPSGWAATALQREQGVPYSVWVLGSDIWSLGRIPGVRSMLRRVIRGATNRFADGLQLAVDAAAIGGKPFEFLPSTRRLDGQRNRPLASAPPYRLLFLGRWHPNKGIDLLLQSLALLDEASWSAIQDVHIAGGGPMEDIVRQRVAGLQSLGRPIRLSGFLDRVQATAALSDADYLLIPSRIESIPVVFSDAMKMQLPVVSMPVGDLPALVRRHAVGTIATGVDAAAFADAVRRTLTRSPSDFSSGMLACCRDFLIDPRLLCSKLGLEPGRAGK